MSALVANARWEVLRWVRSRRIFLLVIPLIAGPIGSALAFLYFRHVQANGTVLTNGTALLLGLFVTGGLSAMVTLDLAALSEGEELSRRSHLLSLSLPQSRAEVLGGRLMLVLGSTLAIFALAGALVWPIASLVVPVQPTDPAPLFPPFHLYEGILALLFFLGASTVTASIIARSASEALVAGVLAGVVTASAAGYLAYVHQITMVFPAVLVVVGAVALGWAFTRFEALDT